MDVEAWRVSAHRPTGEAAVSDVTRMIARSGSIRAYQRGETIFQQGDAAEAIFVVLNGWVKVYRERENGEQAIIRILGADETYFEPAMFAGGIFLTSAEAISSVRILRIADSVVRQAILNTPRFAFDLLEATFQDIESLIEQVEQLRTRSTAQRIAEVFLHEVPIRSESATIALPYSKATIAGYVGAKPETFSRSLVQLRKHGVTIKRDRVTVSDVEKLAKYARGQCGAINGDGKAVLPTPFASLGKRRSFDDGLLRAWRKSQQFGAPISLLLIDVDHDMPGGDGFVRSHDRRLLTEVGNVISCDAQIGGRLMVHFDESVFAVAAPATDQVGATTLAQKISTAIRNVVPPHAEDATSSSMLPSIGTATIVPSAQDRIEKIICFADIALYRAKTLERGNICSFHDDSSCVMAKRSPSGGVRIPVIEASHCAECRFDAFTARQRASSGAVRSEAMGKRDMVHVTDGPQPP